MMRMRKKQKERLLTFIILGMIALVGGITLMFLIKKPGTLSPIKDKPIEKVPEPIKKVQVIDEESISRPYAVMINNNESVWKYQSGLNDAYIIYEMLVEGGITREMALYKDKDTSKIASIRSSRHYFLDYALENDAIYVHWGWSPKAQSDIKSLGVNNVNGMTYEGTYFFRDKTMPKSVGMEHKGYTTMESLTKAATKLKYRVTTDTKPLLTYDVDSIDLTKFEGVQDAKYIEIPYSGGYKAKFYYDEDTKLYKKTQNKIEMIDYTSKERFTNKNIILYNVSYSTMDSKGRQDMKNIGSGTGYLITEGKSIPITWEKTSRAGKTTYKYLDGSNLIVNDGTTYIGLLPSSKKPTISETIPE